MSKWSQIYEKQMGEFDSLEKFIDNKIAYKSKLIDTVKKFGSKTKALLEVGCGSGVTSTAISLQGYFVTGIDSDPDMVMLAKTIGRNQKSSAKFEVDSLNQLEKVKYQHFDVIFSNGVMEHFSDEDIVLIINFHLSISDHVIVSVPSDYFSHDQRIYGDERFMSAEKWKSILSKTRGSIVESFTFNSNDQITRTPQFIGFVVSSV